MGNSYKLGFTIIETMLFLSITGILVVALLAGSGASINQQRYKDSVTTFQSTLQRQYSDVTSVSNDRSTSDACTALSGDSTATLLGQSDCVVIGKYVTVVDTQISISTVIGLPPAANIDSLNDVAQLKAYKLAVVSDSTETSDLEWGAGIAWPSSGSGSKSSTHPRSISVLILRSPTSGLNYTFTADDTSTGLGDMIVASNTVPGQEQRRLCIDSNGLFDGGLAVVINQAATNANDIQVRSNDMGDDSTC